MNRVRWTLVSAILVTSLIAVSIVIVTLLPDTGVDLVSIGVNALLTLGLLYLYRKTALSQEEQTEIQRNQSDIQSNQTEIMELQADILLMNQTPVIVVEELSGDNDDLLISLSNIGDGYLRGLSMKINYVPTDPELNETDYDQLDFDSVILVQPSRENIGSRFTGGSVLAPGEDSITFRANAKLPALKPKGGVTTDFSHSIGEAYKEGIREIAFQIILIYRPVVPDSERIQYGLEPRQLSLDAPDITFSEALELSESARRYPTGDDSPLVSLGPTPYEDERAIGRMLNRL